ncbi:hypothetical protein PoMZ_13557 [Pyricularia oryzae]|uniref:Lysine-specific metallo-endopeptidase domain-containing protein n=1 Tax=Pyricularia oryzae TaxID=318829 RepID=A0A4P7NVE0_PYROR|nr:hypothetical protein PoMZ_13557 [Pyricularia oryzae]
MLLFYRFCTKVDLTWTPALPLSKPPCKELADAAYWDVKKQSDLRFRYFKTHSQSDIDALQKAYFRIEKACDLDSDNIVFRCDPPNHKCNTSAGYVPLYPADESNNQVFLCPLFFDKYEYHDLKKGRILVHETSHLPSIRNTMDYDTYGLYDSLGLSKEFSLYHADTFGWFALAAYNKDY